MLLPIVQDEARWLPLDVHVVIFAAEAARGSRSPIPIAQIGDRSSSAIRDLTTVADRQRVAPHDSHDINTLVTSKGFVRPGSNPPSRDLLMVFTGLIDLIERGGIPSP